jgi:hypothetical protein
MGRAPPRRGHRGLIGGCLLSAAFCLSSCAQSPADVVAAYGRAIAAGRYTRAHRLLTAEERARTSPAQLAAAGALAVDDQRRPTRRARLPDNSLVLEEGKDGFVVSAGALEFYGCDTPRRALSTFIKAVERGRYDIVYGLAPERFRRALTVEALGAAMSEDPELPGRLSALKLHLSEPISIKGKGAVLYYEEGGAELLFEGGCWRVADLQ